MSESEKTSPTGSGRHLQVTEVPARPPSPRPRGLRGRLLASLEGYLTRAATELDQRGEQLRERAAALETRSAELEAAEAKVADRERRLAELGLAHATEAERIERLLTELATRDASLAQARSDHEAQRRWSVAREDLVAGHEAKLAAAEARLAEQGRRLAELDAARRHEREELARVRAELERREADLAQRTAELGEQRRRVAESDQSRREQGERLAAAERELAATTARLEERERRVAELMAAHEAELELLLGRVAERERALAESEAALETERVNLAAAEATLAEQGRRVAELDDVRTQEHEELARARAELERREAELSRRTAELAASEQARGEQAERLGAIERDLAATLGRLEERERRLAEVTAAHEGELDRLLARVAARERALVESEARTGEPDGKDEAKTVLPEAGESDADHLLFVPLRTRYALLERDGQAPEAGAELDVRDEESERRFRVSRVGASPLPLDARRCAYLEPVD